ncbi:uncharacterized protein UV8b_01328 [Ustilaginoidea virens]|uniref:Cell wall galactomannoprotein n=1 Tax=Ustilaginoidea virens TaxID=1159556 RepID=A0A063C294_USTVR|nr:uncharacterized protein UV8b_01328 [Ustilaginoidea virens]QUC17087.1 hypothetical protein UV8b_01328 [Ustilaginoidea virens]GAO17683.1 hypothetical protein UVI_02058440 [Ustilaginoidea virens]
MQLKLLCSVALAASVFAVDADPLVATLNSINNAYAAINQGIRVWTGDYTGAVALISQASKLATAIAQTPAPDPSTTPTDATLQERQAALDAVAKTLDDYLEIAYAVKPKVERVIPPIKALVVAVVKALQDGFSALAKIYLAAVPDGKKAASQAAFARIDNNLQTVIRLYSS